MLTNSIFSEKKVRDSENTVGEKHALPNVVC